MSKRFTDTDKWKKGFIRGLEPAYKLLWLYITDDCNHAGIWDVDLEVAAIRIGMPIDKQKALSQLGDHIQIVDDGKKWYIPAFVDFQYGVLNPENRAHQSVIQSLEKCKVKPLIKPLTTSLQGRKDKDKDKEYELSEVEDEARRELHNMYSRRDTTPWSDKEIKQLRIIAKRENVLEEIAEMAEARQSGWKYYRKDIITLLNNWQGELDRIRNNSDTQAEGEGGKW